MPPISYEEAHGAPVGYYPPATKAARGGLPPELEARVQDLTLDRGDVQQACCREAEAAGQSWDGRCKRHKGTPAQRAEQRRWERKAAATMLAQTLGRAGDYVRVVPFDTATQEDSRQPMPLLERHYVT
jgi:hypothetical protein